MLGQNHAKIHQFDVCGRVYYRGIDYTNREGELVVETLEATSHDEAEQLFLKAVDELAREFNQTVARVEMTFTLDLTLVEDGESDEPYLVH